MARARGSRVASARRRAASAKVLLAVGGLCSFLGTAALARVSYPGHVKRHPRSLSPPKRFVSIVRQNQLQGGILAPAQAPPEERAADSRAARLLRWVTESYARRIATALVPLSVLYQVWRVHSIFTFDASILLAATKEGHCACAPSGAGAPRILPSRSFGLEMPFFFSVMIAKAGAS